MRCGMPWRGDEGEYQVPRAALTAANSSLVRSSPCLQAEPRRQRAGTKDHGGAASGVAELRYL